MKPASAALVSVFQELYALFPHMTVTENVAFGLEMQRCHPRPSVRARVGEALELVGLGAFTARFPRPLSGGQQQEIGAGPCRC